MRFEINRRRFSENGQSWFDKRYACWANNNGWSKRIEDYSNVKFRQETQKIVKGVFRL